MPKTVASHPLRPEVAEAVRRFTADASVLERFSQVWTLVEQILEAFARAMHLPIFVFLNDARLFVSSATTMPDFCAAMLSADETTGRCNHDGITTC